MNVRQVACTHTKLIHGSVQAARQPRYIIFAFVHELAVVSKGRGCVQQSRLIFVFTRWAQPCVYTVQSFDNVFEF